MEIKKRDAHELANKMGQQVVVFNSEAELQKATPSLIKEQIAREGKPSGLTAYSVDGKLVVSSDVIDFNTTLASPEISVPHSFARVENRSLVWEKDGEVVASIPLGHAPNFAERISDRAKRALGYGERGGTC